MRTEPEHAAAKAAISDLPIIVLSHGHAPPPNPTTARLLDPNRPPSGPRPST